MKIMLRNNHGFKIGRAARAAFLVAVAAVVVTGAVAQQRIPDRVDGPRIGERQLQDARERLEAARPRLATPTLTTVNAKYLNRLTFRDESAIRASSTEFTIFASGESGSDLVCWDGADPTIFFTPACGDDAACLAKTNRMSSMLLAAKLAGKPVTISHEVCVVYEVTLN